MAEHDSMNRAGRALTLVAWRGAVETEQISGSSLFMNLLLHVSALSLIEIAIDQKSASFEHGVELRGCPACRLQAGQFFEITP